ncbi:putative mitochondrial protein [Tanacetum coccineum]
MNGKKLTKHISLPGNPQLSSMCCLCPTATLNAMHFQEGQVEDMDVGLNELLQEYEDVFQVPTLLHPHKSFDHAIPLIDPSTIVSIRPYRFLNKNTIKDKFLIYVIDELIDEFHGAKFFSKLDLRLLQEWSPQAQLAFEKLKTTMIKSHVLALSNFEEEFFIETDTSGFGIGVVLQQHDHPIAYLGKTLAPIHQSLSTYEKELLVVVLALQK